ILSPGAPSSTTDITVGYAYYDVDNDQYIVPLADLGATFGDKLYIAAHAVVGKGGCDEETAWAEGCGNFYNRAGKIKGWAMYGDFWVPSPS
ncbi:MAG: hypothetical protein ACFFBD_28235, partial [Candidatus Hodarchaeota archaeon]